MKKVFSLFLVCLVTAFSVSSAPAADHLASAVKYLTLLTNKTSDHFYDITHDGKVDLADAVFALQLAAGLGGSPVTEPTLRTTLPASWDEDWFASVAVYDLDDDGSMEIIAGRHSVLYVWNSDGTLKWSAPVGENATPSIEHASSRQYASPVVGDLDDDGKGEIAICFSNKVAVYDHNGTLQSGWPQSFPGSSSEIRSIAAEDLDGNGTKEILVVKTSSAPVTMVWNINGTARSGWPQVADCPECNNFGGYSQNIGAADLDGDQTPEVISTYDICHIGFNYANGDPLPAHEMFSGVYASSVPLFHSIDLAIQGWGPNMNDRDELTDSPPVFADLDGDQANEVIVYSDHELAGEYVNRGNCLWVLNGDMTRVAGFETPICSGAPLYTGYQNNIVQVVPAPALADLEGDTRPEIVVPSYDGYMRAFSPTGALLWAYQFDQSGGSFIGASGAAVGDLNRDGVPEIIFSTYSIDQDKSHLIILDAQGTQLYRISLEKRGSMSVPTLADVDGDNVVEILVSLKDTLGGGVGGVQIYEMASSSTNYLPWPTGRGNLLRNGRQER